MVGAKDVNATFCTHNSHFGENVRVLVDRMRGGLSMLSVLLWRGLKVHRDSWKGLDGSTIQKFGTAMVHFTDQGLPSARCRCSSWRTLLDLFLL